MKIIKMDFRLLEDKDKFNKKNKNKIKRIRLYIILKKIYKINHQY